MVERAIEIEKHVRWETPVSDAKSLGMVSLIQDNAKLELKIILEDARDPERKRYSITFSKYVPAYKNVQETYCLSEFSKLPKDIEFSWTQEVFGSKWLKDFKVNEPFLHANYENIRHFLIITEDDTISILADVEPIIDFIGCAELNDPPPGISTVFHHPEDREEIDSFFASLKSGDVDD